MSNRGDLFLYDSTIIVTFTKGTFVYTQDLVFEDERMILAPHQGFERNGTYVLSISYADADVSDLLVEYIRGYLL